MGLTNNVFTFNPDAEENIIKRIDSYTEEEQMLMIICYVKQKLVIYLTLKNYLTNVRNTNDEAMKKADT